MKIKEKEKEVDNTQKQNYRSSQTAYTQQPPTQY